MDRIVAMVLVWLLTIAALTGNAGCHSGAGFPQTPATENEADALPPSALTQLAWFPTGLPDDCPLPGERVDANGNVVLEARPVSVINSNSVFASGAERVDASAAGVSDNLDAAHLTSGAAGSHDVSWARWRLTMGGGQPGVFCADANLLPRSDGSLSEYYLGIADYGRGSWEWHGPIASNHVRISTAARVANGADYLSALGNLHICVVVTGGSACDVIGVAANALDEADPDPPAAPSGLTALPIAGGLELVWVGVQAQDLAGYRVYYSDKWFVDKAATSLSWTTYLIGRTEYRLLGLDTWTFVRISAIDIAGRESEWSEFAQDDPLVGAAPDLRLATSQPSCTCNDSVTLQASGGDLYDWDLDGKGVWNVTGTPSVTAQADTHVAGVIRPLVRGYASGGTAIAYASVSILVHGS